jgi:hypothetical protein
MSLEDFDDKDYFDPHENCVSVDDALQHALENHWGEVEEAIGDYHAQGWLLKSRSCLELLSVVSRRDRAHMSGALKKWLRKKQNGGADPSEEQLFSIAADVAAFLEELSITTPLPPVIHDIDLHGYQGTHAPTTERCIAFSAEKYRLADDLSWAKDLLLVTRAFRDFLSAISDTDLQQPYLRLRIQEPIQTINSYVHKTPSQLLIYWQEADKNLVFGRCPETESSDLSSYIANWICDYLTNYHSYVGLGVCAECGKVFVRERRDKSFCSKTCQNRVAYKRKKLLDSDALSKVDFAPDDACDIVPGLWIYHPRYGIGLIESTSSEGKPIATQLVKIAVNKDSVARHRSMLSRKIILQAHFSHGVRIFGYSDLFEAQKREEQLPTFYEVKSEETLAELL